MTEIINDIPTMYNVSYKIRNDLLEIPNIVKLKKIGIAINGVGYHTEFIDSNYNVIARVDNLPYDMERHDFPYKGSGVFGETERCDICNNRRNNKIV